MKDLFDRFQKAVDGLSQAITGNKEEPQEMNAQTFLTYAIEQVEKAAKDEPAVRTERLKALRGYVELAKQEYSFEGKSNVLTGMLSVVQFRDPGQVQTTEKTQAPSMIKEGQTNYADVPIQPAVNGAGNATGQKMPPLFAGGSGFETPGSASFAKALEDLGTLLSSMTVEESKEEKTEEEKVETKKSEEPKEEKVETKKSETQPEEKKDQAYWPFDMNTPFGRGETKDPEIPEWGIDGQAIPNEDQPEA